MERMCEFCAGLKPIIYCKPDAAHLCLSCDAKVHSANALSSRHLRTVLCDLCRIFPTYLRCLDHQMFLCRNCDKKVHDSSASKHQKTIIRGYMGCPSARDFAALWGLKITELDDINISRDQFVLACGSETSSITNLEISGPERRAGSLPHQIKKVYEGHEQKRLSFILQQILDLRRFQVVKGNNNSPLIRGEKFDELHLQHSKDLGTDLQQENNLLQELKLTALLFPISQLESSTLPPAISLPFQGESLWQFKSPTESSQLWSQNMQDLGVCDELVSCDDFDIPEVDLTFHNFEDLFDGDQDPKDVSFSSLDKDMSLHESNNQQVKEMEASSVTSTIGIFQSALIDKEHIEPARQIRSSLSSLSVSDSRFSFDSAGSDYLDRKGCETSCGSPCCREHEHSVAIDNIESRRYKENKPSQLQEVKRFRPTDRKPS